MRIRYPASQAMSKELANQHLNEWNESIGLAEAALPIIGSLFRDSGVS